MGGGSCQARHPGEVLTYVCVPPCRNIDPDGDFSPNVINSAVFLLSNAMQASTFLVNYQVGYSGMVVVCRISVS